MGCWDLGSLKSGRVKKLVKGNCRGRVYYHTAELGWALNALRRKRHQMLPGPREQNSRDAIQTTTERAAHDYKSKTPQKGKLSFVGPHQRGWGLSPVMRCPAEGAGGGGRDHQGASVCPTSCLTLSSLHPPPHSLIQHTPSAQVGAWLPLQTSSGSSYGAETGAAHFCLPSVPVMGI